MKKAIWIEKLVLGGLLSGALIAGAPRSASAETVTVPLSDPSRPAVVKAGLVNGGMIIEAWPGKEVVVEAVGRDEDSSDKNDRERDKEKDKHRHEHGRDSGDSLDAVIDQAVDEAVDGAVGGALAGGKDEDREQRQKEDKAKGMRRIPNAGLGLSVEEAQNVVRIESESWRRTVDLHIKVPAGTILKLGCVNDGDIEVRNVKGDMELSNTNGSITVEGAAGTVVANTVNGEVKVTFERLAAFRSMAFSSLNGDIDVTLPPGINADVRMSSDNGEIYSDFDIKLQPRASQAQPEHSGGKFKVTIGKEMYGAIGSGGPDVLFKTFNGDIYIRKGK